MKLKSNVLISEDFRSDYRTFETSNFTKLDYESLGRGVHGSIPEYSSPTIFSLYVVDHGTKFEAFPLLLRHRKLGKIGNWET